MKIQMIQDIEIKTHKTPNADVDTHRTQKIETEIQIIPEMQLV